MPFVIPIVVGAASAVASGAAAVAGVVASGAAAAAGAVASGVAAAGTAAAGAVAGLGTGGAIGTGVGIVKTVGDAIHSVTDSAGAVKGSVDQIKETVKPVTDAVDTVTSVVKSVSPPPPTVAANTPGVNAPIQLDAAPQKSQDAQAGLNQRVTTELPSQPANLGPFPPVSYDDASAYGVRSKGQAIPIPLLLAAGLAAVFMITRRR